MITLRMNARRSLLATIAVALLLSSCAKHAPGSTAATTTGLTFATPKAALDALLAACQANDEAKVIAIFGEEAKPIVSTGDAAADRERCEKLLEASKQSTRLDPTGPETVQIVVGTDDWALPIPLVKAGKAWHFDVAAGMQEIRRRKIGANELEAIAACHVYVEAQEEYAARRIGGGKAYAQRIVSTPGKKDGLYWESTGKKDASPLSPIVADLAETSGVWRGYRFRILTAQGADAPGGARDYVAKGKMTGGFALVATPAVYGSTGIMTFVVGPDGRVYEKDLGDKTDATVAAMTAYDPNTTWKLVGG
ncbi:MAG TPA: DUF2950 domain-containing protein [Candidatus Binatia bacterium]|nr:DUF2950 domain-containing protein [Candidatus Binatia bacterium]